MTTLDSVKLLLDNTEGMDDKLNAIIDLTESRLKTLLAQSSVPDELQYIVIEVTLIRFNRIGSEGVSSHTVEGESMSFNDNDFSSFQDDIDAWRSAHKDIKKGKVVFL